MGRRGKNLSGPSEVNGDDHDEVQAKNSLGNNDHGFRDEYLGFLASR